MFTGGETLFLKLDKNGIITVGGNSFLKEGTNFFDYVKGHNEERADLEANDSFITKVTFLYKEFLVEKMIFFKKKGDDREIIIFGKEIDEMRIRDEQYGMILRMFDDFFLEYDQTTRVVTINCFAKRSVEKVLLDDIIDPNKNVCGIYPDDFKHVKEDISNVKNNIILSVFRAKLPGIDSDYHWYKLEGTVYREDVVRGFGRMRNIDDVVTERENVIKQSLLDPLSNVMQKEGIINYIERYINNNKDGKFTLFILDLDYFKNINDSMGHSFGDFVIKAVAAALSRLIGEKGRIGRTEGDAFLFIMENMKSEYEIRELCREIRFSLEQLDLDNGETFKVSATTGIVQYPKDGNKFDVLYRNLDKALYRGKSKGKDCYIIYDEKVHGSIDPANAKTYTDFKRSQGVKVNNNAFTIKCMNELFDSINISESIKSVIEKIGVFFQIDRIVVVEEKKGKLQITYNWVSTEQAVRGMEEYCKLDLTEYEKNFDNDWVYFVNDVLSELDGNNRDAVMNSYKTFNSRAFIQIGFVREEKLIGFISYEMCTQKRVWIRDELFYYSVLSKILDTFIMRLEQEASISEIAYKDKVTQSWNLNRFKDIYGEMIKSNENKKIAVSIDVENFKTVNYRFGYFEGDTSLLSISNLLREELYEKEEFCRIGDDKFLMIMNYNGEQEIRERIEIIAQKIYHIKTSKGVVIEMGIKAGGYLIRPNDPFTEVLDNVGFARRYTRVTKTLFEIYNDIIEEKVRKDKEIEMNMYKALNDKEFLVYFQPCYSLSTGKVCSLEALVRWKKDGRIIPPGDFIPLFEKNGFIELLDFYVYDVVCSTLSKWKEEGKYLLPISVNVSRAHIMDSDFLEKIDGMLEKYDIEKRLLCLELTEGLFFDNERIMIDFIKKIKKKGLKVYMDDFGVAYSNLTLLSKIDVDVLKLDKSFFGNKKLTDRERTIVNNVIRMAKELNMDVLSEGIEYEHQVNELRNLGCDYVQGFYFARPMPIEDYEENYQ